jgi:threonine dehydrogenase-like Zn-dependent dehydrogenase
MRADQLLVNQGIAPTRSAAQRLIARGAVRWRGPAGWTVPRKAGENLPEDCEIELTDGLGAHSVPECVGLIESTVTALRIARPGGAVGRIGVPQEHSIPEALTTFMDNVAITGGPAPARAYIEELLPDVLEGRIEPGRVFDRVGRLDDVPDGYRAMNDREAIKVLIEL